MVSSTEYGLLFYWNKLLIDDKVNAAREIISFEYYEREGETKNITKVKTCWWVKTCWCVICSMIYMITLHLYDQTGG